MFWTRLELWFDRTISSNGIRQWIIPALSFGISLIVFSIILLIVNRGWCLLGDTYDATSSFEPENVLDAAFYHMFTNGGQNLFSSHFWGAVITIVGVIVLAILTSSITNFFEQRAKQYLSGETSYYFNNHIVIFGTSDVLYSIIEQLEKGISYVVIQTNRDVEKTRREVFSFIKDNKDKGFNRNKIVFFYGDRTSLGDVKKLHLKSAKEIYIIGENSENENGESYRDAYNIDCIKTIKESIVDPAVEKKLEERANLERMMEENPSIKDQCKDQIKEIENNLKNRDHLRCNIMFEYQTTFSSFQDSDIDYETKVYIDFEPFSFHETWAQKVLVEGNGYEYLYQTGYDETHGATFINKNSEKSVHLVIVGMSKMGVALALEAAQICHFPNFVTNNKKTRITFIDPEADTEQDFFSGRLSHLKKLSTWVSRDAAAEGFKYQSSISSEQNQHEDWLDIEWEFIRGRIEQESVRSFLSDAALDQGHILTLAICLPQSHQAIAASLYLPEIVLRECLQVLVYQRISGSLISQISFNKQGLLAKLKPFGMVESVFSSIIHNDDKAMMVAYSYDTLYGEIIALENSAKKESSNIDVKHLSDEVNWSNVDFQLKGFNQSNYSKGNWRMKVVNRWSSRANANTINVKLRSIGIDPQYAKMEEISNALLEHLDIMKKVEHNRWNIEKLIAGYRPLTAEELSSLPQYGTDEWKTYVDSLKERKAHIDLCSCEQLVERDYNNVCYDEVLIRAIPYIVSHCNSD